MVLKLSELFVHLEHEVAAVRRIILQRKFPRKVETTLKEKWDEDVSSKELQFSKSKRKKNRRKFFRRKVSWKSFHRRTFQEKIKEISLFFFYCFCFLRSLSLSPSPFRFPFLPFPFLFPFPFPLVFFFKFRIVGFEFRLAFCDGFRSSQKIRRKNCRATNRTRATLRGNRFREI